MTRIRLLSSALVCAAGLLSSAAALTQSTYFEEAKITINERARDAGEHVKIRKARRDVANFSVEIAFTAPGFAIILDN